MSQLPYLSAPGNIAKAFGAIKSAATPPKVSQDFVKTKLGIPGSSGNQMATFLKRLGFASSDGSPTELYKAFRGADGAQALAKAIRFAYAPLFERNEYAHDCTDPKLKDLIVQETGQAADARVVSLIFHTLKNLINHADFSDTGEQAAAFVKSSDEMRDSESGANFSRAALVPQRSQDESFKLNLGYTINLNLPETSDIEVFNAIFKSLKENLLRSSND